ncbi:MAG: hypothetical protein M0P92_06535 [Acholeplasmataceae bacterium]|nr:hypothetical protein [Acholeplasmataceae bacterium]
MSEAIIKAASKEVDRYPIAKVRITWTDPFIDLSIDTSDNGANRVAYPLLCADLITETPKKWFSTNKSKTNAGFFPAPSNYNEARVFQFGFWGSEVADASGEFATNPILNVSFHPRPVFGFTLAGDTARGQYPVNFTIKLQRVVDEIVTDLETLNYIDNDQVVLSGVFPTAHSDATNIQIEISKWSEPGAVVKISELYSAVVKEYDKDDILDLQLLEETDLSDATLPIGNMSSNELSLNLQNLDNELFPSNTHSELYTQIKKNRRIEPFLGFNVSGTDYYIAKGVYWSGDWTVRENDSGAQCSARDRMELFRNIMYEGFSDSEEDVAEMTYWEDIGVKDLLVIILDSLLPVMSDLVYDIDDALNDIVIPIAFFKRQRYFKVIQDLVRAGLGYAYIDLPTETERATSPIVKDVLRIKAFSTVYGSLPEAETITQDDYITKNQPAKTDELANTVTIIKKSFEIDEESGKPKEITDFRYAYTVSDDESVKEFGIMRYEYPESNLLQTEEQVTFIGTSLVNSFKVPRKDIELDMFGDPTLKLTSVIDAPEYQKDGLDIRGIFVVNKIKTHYDGALRATVHGRKGSI